MQELEAFKQPFVQPPWDGSSLSGKTILLWAEQGLGDTLQFIRYAALVKQQGGNRIAVLSQRTSQNPPDLCRHRRHHHRKQPLASL